MAHMIDQSAGINAMAYVGEEPWHGLGQKLTAGAPLDVWRREAGLAYTVERTPVLYTLQGRDASAQVLTMKDRDVLYRSDTEAPLSVVSKGYKVVQPEQVLAFFGKLAEVGGFQLETAGALSDGKRIWALAKVDEGAPIIGQDVVKPYVLLATSYDATMATVARMTSVRVVCHNTLTMADEQTGSDVIRISHDKVFKPDEVRMQLGIVHGAWEKFLMTTRALAGLPVTEAQADALVFDLLSDYQRVDPKKPLPDIRKTKGYATVMGLFDGGAIGAELTGGRNAWALLNACTELVDHHRSKTPNARLESAWFGVGAQIKSNAFQRIIALAQEQGAIEPVAA